MALYYFNSARDVDPKDEEVRIQIELINYKLKQKKSVQ